MAERPVLSSRPAMMESRRVEEMLFCGDGGWLCTVLRSTFNVSRSYTPFHSGNLVMRRMRSPAVASLQIQIRKFLASTTCQSI